jgi:hypothetical protein
VKRALITLLLVVLMAVFGFGVNRFLAAKRAAITTSAAVAKPSQTKPVFVLPGRIFLAQHGDIYSLSNGRFTDLDLPSNGTWMQPAVVPGTDDIVAVLRSAAYSDLYLIGANGRVLQQLSHNATKTSTVQMNHWMFWPHVSSDGSTIYLSYDEPKTSASYRVDFAVWQGTIGGKLTSREITVPFDYTGGDVAATPLPNGSVLYAKYQVSGITVFSQIALQTKALTFPVLLTDSASDCGQPALSPDAAQIAMICSGGTGLQNTRLEVAPLQGNALGAPRVLVDNCLCSAPAWAPDGSGIVYYAPADPSGHFQLWWIAGAGGTLPKPPRQVTTDLDFDALSPPAWLGPPAPAVITPSPAAVPSPS